MSKLFSSNDIRNNSVAINSKTVTQLPEALSFNSDAEFVVDGELEIIRNKINDIQPGKSYYFMTAGAWSNYHLLEYILQITGPAEVSFTTWAISEVAITKFLAWKEAGMITDLYAVIDVGLRNRKPTVYDQAAQAFTNLKMAHCHAKATVVISATHHITFIGSSNYTRNPRLEVGVLIYDKAVALANRQWIQEVIRS